MVNPVSPGCHPGLRSVVPSALQETFPRYSHSEVEWAGGSLRVEARRRRDAQAAMFMYHAPFVQLLKVPQIRHRDEHPHKVKSGRGRTVLDWRLIPWGLLGATVIYGPASCGLLCLFILSRFGSQETPHNRRRKYIGCRRLNGVYREQRENHLPDVRS